MTVLSAIRRFWCRFAHPVEMLTRPVYGTYRCLACMEQYRVPWEPEPVKLEALIVEEADA